MPNERLTVSVVMPVYGGERFLRPSIEAVLDQSYRELELIVIDDGSPDASAAIARDYLADPRVKVFSKANGGVASARNYGVAQCRGDLVAFCDQDDVWLPDKLERQIALFSNPDTVLVHGWGAIARREDLADAIEPHAVSTDLEGDLLHEIVRRNFVICSSALLRRQVLLDVGPFDEDPAINGVDDWNMWVRVATRGRIDVVKDIVVLVRRHGANQSSNEGRMLAAELACLEKLEPLLPPADARAMVRDSRFEASRHYAGNFFHAGDYRAAARCLHLAWRQRPRRVDLLALAAALALTPAAAWNGLRRLKRVVGDSGRTTMPDAARDVAPPDGARSSPAGSPDTSAAEPRTDTPRPSTASAHHASSVDP
ncbi:MAG: glycosyltransferase [Burkholderiaceae bacterium]